MLLLALTVMINVECEILRFDDGIAEFWYRVPISDIIKTTDTAGVIVGTIDLQIQYELKIFNFQENDSGMIRGEKKVPILLPLPPDEQYCVEYIPLTLYPGNFEFQLLVHNDIDSGHVQKHIEIKNIADHIGFSDLIIGKKTTTQGFTYRGLNFYPSTTRFSLFDTLYSYVELYGLRPDSLDYIAAYALLDSSNKMIFSNKYKRKKLDYFQIETLSVHLGNLVEGSYQLEVNIEEPLSGAMFKQRRTFKIVSRISDAIGKKFYRDINYLVDGREYKKFIKLNAQEQELFLKNFWKRNDYWVFEERMLAADLVFSIHGLKGRDSHRGAYLIAFGEPEEREIIPMLQWGRQLELWHYYTHGKDVLFCDIKQDGNPRFIAELDVGELTRILETGVRDKDDLEKYPWLKEIAPGTFEQKTMDDIDQQYRLRDPDEF